MNVGKREASELTLAQIRGAVDNDPIRKAVNLLFLDMFNEHIDRVTLGFGRVRDSCDRRMA